MENQTTGLRPMEMHPYPRLRRYFPRRGKSALLSAFGLIQYEQHFGELAACSGFPPLWCLRHHLSPRKSGGTTPRAMLRVTYENTASRSFVLPPLAGEVPRSGQGGNAFPSPEGRLYGFLFSHGRSPVVKVLSKLAPSIILKAPTTTLSGEAAVKPENPRGESPVKPRPRSGRQPSRPQGVSFPHKKRSRQSSFFFQFYFWSAR